MSTKLMPKTLSEASGMGRGGAFQNLIKQLHPTISRMIELGFDESDVVAAVKKIFDSTP